MRRIGGSGCLRGCRRLEKFGGLSFGYMLSPGKFSAQDHSAHFVSQHRAADLHLDVGMLQRPVSVKIPVELREAAVPAISKGMAVDDQIAA